VARSYAQRAALEVTNTAFGGSFGSMLMQALRVKSGLSYSAHAGFHRGAVAGEFAISSFTQTASTARAIDTALQTLSTLKQQGVSNAAIESARSYILGQYALGFETGTRLGGSAGGPGPLSPAGQLHRRFSPAAAGRDAAASKQVVADAYPDADDVDIVLIGDAARIRAEVAKLGPVSREAAGGAGLSPPHRLHKEQG
jgi:zinc protease